MIVTTVAPGPNSSANRKAAITLHPVDVPAKSPSSRARRKAIAYGIFRRHALDPVADVIPPERYHKSRPDAVNLVRPRRASRKHGRLRRFDGNHCDFLATLSQPLYRAAKRRSRSNALHETVDFLVRLRPDLVSQRVIGSQLIGISQLIGPEPACLLGDDARGLHHVAGQFSSHAPAIARHDL